MLLALAVSLVVAIDLPLAAPGGSAMLREPNAQRARVTVTADAIVIRPKRSTDELKVMLPTRWTPAPGDLEGRRIVPIGAALAPPKPDDEDLPDRFFSSELDEWLELYVERGAPWSLVLDVMMTAMDHARTFGIAIRTPQGVRLLVVSPPDGTEPLGDVATLAIERDALLVITDGAPPKKSKRTPDAVRTALTSFAKKKSNGRQALLPGTLGRPCLDANKKVVPVAQCWRASVVVAAMDGVVWGDALPLAAVAAETVPWVFFGAGP